MSLDTITSRLPRREPKAWQRPTYDGPIQIKTSELTPLGSHNGRYWYAHRRHGELEERPGRYHEEVWADTRPHEDPLKLRAADPLPDGPVTSEYGPDGARQYVAYRVHPPGTFAALTAVRPVVIAKPARVGPLDALRAARWRPLLLRLDRTWANGPAEIVAQLRAKGYHLTPSLDKRTLRCDGKRHGVAILEFLALAGPLLLAHLNGAPLVCQYRDHGEAGQPEAVTVDPGGTPMCAACRDGAS